MSNVGGRAARKARPLSIKIMDLAAGGDERRAPLGWDGRGRPVPTRATVAFPAGPLSPHDLFLWLPWLGFCRRRSPLWGRLGV